MTAMPDDTRAGAWALADARAVPLNIDPPSDRAWLVERMAWAIHVTQAGGSPRAAWLEQDDSQRATLYLRAAAALAAADRYREFEPSS
jgi:hypothetical protein